LTNYGELGVALVNSVKTGTLSHLDAEKIGLSIAGEIIGDPESARINAPQYGPQVDEPALRKEIAELTEAQLIRLRGVVTIWQQVLPPIFKPAMKSWIDKLPALPGGRHASLTDDQKRKVCERLVELQTQKVKLGDGMERMAVKYDTSVSTISRAWAERDKLLALSNHAEAQETSIERENAQKQSLTKSKSHKGQ
jgi:hypothetical protein